MAKSKSVSGKVVPSSIVHLPAENIMRVERDVNQDEIRRAYHQLACQYHHDVGKKPDIGFKDRGAMSDER